MPRTTGSKLLDFLKKSGAKRFELAASPVLEQHGIAAYYPNVVAVAATAFKLRKQGYHAVDLSKESKPRLEVYSLDEGSASGSQREVARAVYFVLQEKNVDPGKVAWKSKAHDPAQEGTWGAKEWTRIERLRRRK